MKRAKRMGTGAAATAVALLGTGVITSAPANAHGYVEGPLSRSAACAAGLNSGCGSIVYEPQSLEAPKGFPEAGPADGQIASAGGLFGGVLDQQSADRWYKNEITTGPLLMDWKYTAPHSTSKWHYYMTKQGWDPNAPLDRADLELVAEVEHDGSKASTNPDHTITVPSDRSGYHVILAVWDISDTVNAFYNVIDVDVVGEGNPDTTPPTIPVDVEATSLTATSAELSWLASSDDSGSVRYDVYRDGALVGASAVPEFSDAGLAPATAYQYTVVAVDPSGNRSPVSASLAVTTDTAPVIDTVAPSIPGYLHSMGQTENSVSLMWNESTDNSGSVSYRVLRDGVQVGSTGMTMLMDGGLERGTTYSYTVVAVDAAGNESSPSNQLTVTTESVVVPEPQPEPEPQPDPGGTWNPSESYAAGDLVTYGGATYRAVQSHTGIGDPNWIMAPSLWSVVVDAPAPEPEVEPAPEVGAESWNPTGSYTAGDRVTFQGSVYEAVRAHTGNGDPNWIYAPSLWKAV